MTPADMRKITADRLRSFHLFSEPTISYIADFAKQQVAYETYQQFLKAAGVPEVAVFVTKEGKGVPVIDIAAKEKQKGVIAFYVPMGNSLDPNQLYQVATIAATNPAYRVIAFGNPSGKPFHYREQNLSMQERFQISFTKNLRPAITTELEYIRSQGLTQVYHVGYSYGALKALLAARYANPEEVAGLVLIDPVAHPRYPQQLLGDFTRTMGPLGEYVNRTQLQTFLDARQDAVKFVNYSKGLMRPINIAIGFMLARADFIQILKEVLVKLPKLPVTVAWGTKSELGNDAHMSVSMDELSKNYPGVRPVRLEGDTHAFANDIHLHAALVHEALPSD